MVFSLCDGDECHYAGAEARGEAGRKTSADDN